MSKMFGDSLGARGDVSLRGVEPVMMREMSPVNVGVGVGSCCALIVVDHEHRKPTALYELALHQP
jgi:hypothetical protein